MANFEDADKAVLELFENEVENAPEESGMSNEGEILHSVQNDNEAVQNENEETGNTAEATVLSETAENTSEEVPAEGEGTETAVPAETLTPEQQVTEEAVQMAEQATAAAQEKDMQYQQVMQDVTALKEQNAQQQKVIEELSNVNKQNAVEDLLKPPELNYDELAFATEGERQAAMAKFTQEMQDFSKASMMKDLEPFIEEAKRGRAEREKAETVEMLTREYSAELPNLKEMMPQIERIMEGNVALKSDEMPMEEKIIAAYAIARGVNAMNTPPPAPAEPKEPTAEELMEYYEKNPAFQELIEKKRIEQVKESQQVPNFSASSGAVNAALNIKKQPKTLEEAHRLTALGFESL